MDNKETKVTWGVEEGFKFGFGFGAGIFLWILICAAIVIFMLSTSFDAVGNRAGTATNYMGLTNY